MKIDLLEVVLADLKTRNENSFDYHEFVGKFDAINNCASMSCVAGDLPRIFPNDWAWEIHCNINVSIRFIQSTTGDFDLDICSFFEINNAISYALFYGAGLLYIQPICLSSRLPEVINHWENIISYLKTETHFKHF